MVCGSTHGFHEVVRAVRVPYCLLDLLGWCLSGRVLSTRQTRYRVILRSGLCFDAKKQDFLIEPRLVFWQRFWAQVQGMNLTPFRCYPTVVGSPDPVVL